MKNTRFGTLLAVAFGLALFGGSASAQQYKIGIVDMKRIFAEYHKTKDAEKDINQGKQKAKTELDDMTAKYKVFLEQFQQLAEQVRDEALNPDLREQKRKEAEQVGQKAKLLERQIAEFRTRRERQLQESVVRMRRTILEEIRLLVEERSKTDNYDLVFDRSGLSVNGVPFLLHSKDAVDFTDEIITVLNEDAPASGEKNGE